MFRTKIIRGSIDRPEITLILKTIPREHLSGFDPLYFLIEEGTEKTTIRGTTNGDRLEGSIIERKVEAATLEEILKTIIFIDGRKKVSKAVDTIR